MRGRFGGSTVRRFEPTCRSHPPIRRSADPPKLVRFRVWWWVGVFLGLLSPHGAAQSVPSVLTLDDALAIARERNPQYRQTVNQLRAAGAEVRSGLGGFLPTLSANVSLSGYSSTQVTGVDEYGRPTGTLDYRRSSSSQSVGASLTLFDGLRNLSDLRAAQANAVRAGEAQVRALEQLEAETTRRFYEALRTERLIDLEERLLESAREQLENTERLFRTAGATQEDVLGAQADVANQELAYERARGEAEKALLALKEYLGILEPVTFRVAGDVPEAFDPTALDVEGLVQVALSEGSEVRRLDAAASAAAYRVRAARSSRWPTIRLNAGYGRSISDTGYAKLTELRPPNRTFSFGLGFDLPIFSGFQTSWQIANAQVEADNADEQLRAGRLQVERAVRAAYIDLRNAYRALGLAERAAALSLERLRLARERYAIAAITFANLQILIDQAAQAERQLLSAQFEHARAVVNLGEAVGGEVGQ
jgi:outer membrane protein